MIDNANNDAGAWVYYKLIYEPLAQVSYNQRTNGPVNAHLISGPTVSIKTSFANFDIVLKWVNVNSGSSFILTL